MGMTMAVIGFLGFFVCVGGLIVQLLRHRPKKKPTVGLVVCVFLFLLGAFLMPKSGDDNEPRSSQNQGSQTSPELPSDTNAEMSGSANTQVVDGSSQLKSGSYNLQCGMDLLFFESVRNDVTGNWRLSETSSSLVPADYAMEYYQTMFSSDEELHGIWNATLGTITCIKATSGLLFVDTYEYVEGEEHDAKIMFSGTLLDSKIIDIATGNEIDK